MRFLAVVTLLCLAGCSAWSGGDQVGAMDRGPGCPGPDSGWDDCDPDLDGVANRDEPDADRDGISDGYEVAHAGYDAGHADLCLEVLKHPDAPRGVSAALEDEFREAYAAVPWANPDGSSGIRLRFEAPAAVASLDAFTRMQEGSTTEPCLAVFVGPPADGTDGPASADLNASNPSIQVRLGGVGDDVYAEDPAFVERYYHNRTRALLGHELAHFLFGCGDIPEELRASGECSHTDPRFLACDALSQPVGDCWMPAPTLFEAKSRAGSPLLGGRGPRIIL